MKFSQCGMTDKNTAHSYGPFYDALLQPLVDKEINLLELGVEYGGSILAWSDCLPNAYIIGIDKDLSPLRKNAILWHCLLAERRIELFEMNLYSEYVPALVQKLFQGKKFHIIVDDALHNKDSQCAAFEIFSPYLEQDGVYIIESVFGVYAQYIADFVAKKGLKAEIIHGYHHRPDDILIKVTHGT